MGPWGLVPKIIFYGFSNLVSYAPESSQDFFLGSSNPSWIFEAQMRMLDAAEEERARLIRSAAKRDDIIERLAFEFVNRFAPGSGMINPDFCQHFECLQTGRRRGYPGGKRLKTIPQIMINQRLGHLRPGTISRTQKQDLLLRHAPSFKIPD